ncbi:hypothetical protein BV25DRAFT_1914993 [Artomyces pyxidatus]|uniref:Uncharacterized protein n=1 Tax=Artomyces pyxidatus TaxID=48021 RepID=A0ACB8T715_9AGAM|nr:hypothetical protein BV25DRAFT_1914993 [Artomyces pyxidatus]
MAAHILSLPDDVVLDILENLDYKSLLICQTTCHRLRILVTVSVLLQYKIELAACGMVDGPRGSQTFDVAERLRRLRLYDVAWRQLEWTGHTALPHLIDRYPPSMASGGACLFRNTENPDDDEAEVIVQQISSELRGVKEQHTSFPAHTGHNMLLDPSQDLLIVVPITDPPALPHRCQLHSLSTGEAHPLASVLDPCANIGERILIEIRGDHILEGIQSNPDVVVWDYYVWNWRTGHIESKMPCTTYNSSMRQQARFLDNEHILVLQMAEWRDSKLACIHVLPFTTTLPENDLPPRDVAHLPSHTFLLPKFVQEDPGPLTMSLAYGCLSNAMSLGYFHSDPDERLLSIRVDNAWYARPPKGLDYLFIDIPLMTLRSYFRIHPPSGHSLTVSWDDWGQDTRVTRYDSDGWLDLSDPIITSGMKRAGLRKSAERDGVILEMLDYHPQRVARAIARQRNGGGEKESVFFHSDEFEDKLYDDLRTRLPCLIKQIQLPDELAVVSKDESSMLACCLCEDGVIFMKVNTVGSCITMAWEYRF